MESIKPNTLDCPVCGGKGTFKIFSNQLDIPYFGKVLETTMVCERCKYRRSDIIPLEVKEPKRYILRVSNEEDLNKRVVRSSTGYIRIPELGFEVKPGPASEGYISNVEGVLNRLEDALKMLIRWVDGEERRRGEEILRKIGDVKEGRDSITLIIEDPLGHSAIIGDGVREERLSEEEVKELSDGNTLIMERDKNK